MSLTKAPKRHRFPLSIINQAIGHYHRFNNSYRDIQEQMAFRGIILKKQERKPGDKWHLDEMTVKINGHWFVLWRAVDREGLELDVFLQKRRNKKSAIRFLSRLLRSYPTPRVIVTDKLKSYIKPIRFMYPKVDHRTHKRLNNRAENSHQPTRRKEKILIKFKSPQGAQRVLSLMGKMRNLFSVEVGRYKKKASDQRLSFSAAKAIWLEAALELLAV